MSLPIFPAGDGTYGQEVTESTGSSGAVLTGPASGDLTGTYPSPTIAPGVVTLSKIASSASNAAAGTPSLRSIGITDTTAAAGNHGHSGVYSPVGHTHVESDVTALVSDLAALDTRLDTLEAGSGGSAPRVVRQRVVTGTAGGDVNPSTGGNFVELTGVGEIAINAAVGDYVELNANFLATDLNGVYFDFAVKKAGTLVWFGSSESTIPTVEGDPSLYPSLGPKGGGFVSHIVGAGTLSVDGKIHFVLTIKAAGAGSTFYSSTYPFRWVLKNFGVPSA